MPSQGTRLVLWDLAKCYRPDAAAHDVINVKAPAGSHAHETSLRALMEVIYYTDDDRPPPMALWLMGQRVAARNWSAFLHLSRRYSLPRQGAAASASSTFVEFGYRVPLPELIENFKSRTKKDTTLQVAAALPRRPRRCISSAPPMRHRATRVRHACRPAELFGRLLLQYGRRQGAAHRALGAVPRAEADG